MEIRSHVGRQRGRFDGIRSTTPYESRQVPSDDSQEQAFTAHLDQYYDRVVDAIRDADAILVFGPGEAKGQLLKRIKRARYAGHLLDLEAEGEMTVQQVAAKVREHALGTDEGWKPEACGS